MSEEVHLQIAVGLHLWGIWLFSTLNPTPQLLAVPRDLSLGQMERLSLFLKRLCFSLSRLKSRGENIGHFPPPRTGEGTRTRNLFASNHSCSSERQLWQTQKPSRGFFPACVSPQVFDTLISPRRYEIKTHWPHPNPLESWLRTQEHINPSCQLLSNLY